MPPRRLLTGPASPGHSASALQEKGWLDKAIAHYRLALGLQPDYAAAANGLGYVLQEQGNLHEALACYRQALQIKPSFAAAHANQGQVLADLGESDQAVACLREALRHDAIDASAYASLANVLGGQLPEPDIWACAVAHLALRISTYQRLMEHWRNVLPMPMLEVDYEETVTNLEGTARRLVAWCGLEWEPACLDFCQAKRSAHSLHLNQVRQPLHSRFVQHWRNYQAPLAPLLDGLVPHPSAPIPADPLSRSTTAPAPWSCPLTWRVQDLGRT